MTTLKLQVTSNDAGSPVSNSLCSLSGLKSPTSEDRRLTESVVWSRAPGPSLPLSPVSPRVTTSENKARLRDGAREVLKWVSWILFLRNTMKRYIEKYEYGGCSWSWWPHQCMRNLSRHICQLTNFFSCCLFLYFLLQQLSLLTFVHFLSPPPTSGWNLEHKQFVQHSSVIIIIGFPPQSVHPSKSDLICYYILQMQREVDGGHIWSFVISSCEDVWEELIDELTISLNINLTGHTIPWDILIVTSISIDKHTNIFQCSTFFNPIFRAGHFRFKMFKGNPPTRIIFLHLNTKTER